MVHNFLFSLYAVPFQDLGLMIMILHLNRDWIKAKVGLT